MNVARWFDLAWGQSLAAVLVLAQLALGRLVLNAPGLRELPLAGVERVTFSLGAGLFVSISALTGFALFDRLGMGVLLYSGASLAVIGWWCSRKLHSATVERERIPPRWALALFALWLAPYALQTALPNSDWDSALIHLPLARRLLEEGLWFGDLDGFRAWSYPGGVHLLYAVLIRLGGLTAVVPLNLWFALATIASTYALARRTWGRRAGLFAAGFCAATNVVLELGLDARIDGILALTVVMSVDAMLRWWDEGQPGYLVLAGMALGLAFATRTTAVLLLPPLGLAVLAIAMGRARRDRRVRGMLALGMLLAALPAAPWYVRNLALYGDPAYPLLFGRAYQTASGERAPFRPALSELRARLPSVPDDFLPALSRTDAATRREPNLFNPWHVLRADGIARKPLHWISPFLLLGLVAPLILRDVASAAMLAVALLFYAGVASQSSLIRYALPALPLLAALAGGALARSPRAWTPVLALLLALNLAVNAAFEAALLLRREPARYWSGAVDALTWLERVGYNGSLDAVPMIRHVNAEIAVGRIDPSAPIFMIGEGRGFDLAARYLPDDSVAGIPWLIELVRADGDLEAVYRSLRQRGVRHLLYQPRGILIKRAEAGPVAEELQRFSLWQLERFLRRYGRVVKRTEPGSCTLVELVEPAPSH